MAVLVEAIAVLVRRDRIHESCPGGREGYVGDAPNRTLWGGPWTPKVDRAGSYANEIRPIVRSVPETAPLPINAH